MWKDLAALTKLVPDPVWAAAIGSFLTLLGVRASNKAALKRQKEQLSHDSIERSKERLYKSRLELYPTYIEATSEVINFLARLPNIDPSQEAFRTSFNRYNSLSARVNVICEPATAATVAELAAVLGTQFVKCLEKVSPIHDLETDINLKQRQLDAGYMNFDQIMAEIKRVPSLDSASITTLRERLEKQNSDNKMMTAPLLKMRDDKVDSVKKYSIWVMQEIEAIQPILASAIRKVRSEVDLNEPEEPSSDKLAKMKDAFKSFFSGS